MFLVGDEARTRVRTGLRVWFRSPPRRHGEVDYAREVSFLELFYDLVYVVVVSQAARQLARHIDWIGVRDFGIVFGLIWFAWFNGTFWHELHARPDGRSRIYIFLQMGLLALLAVFIGDAFGRDGSAFAITYAILFLLFTWQWYVVQRVDDPSYRPATTRYLAGMIATVVAVAISAVAPSSVRVEDRTATTIATGMFGLMIGMGIWWNYFDMLGRRVPGQAGARLAGWLFAHLPVTMAIAASGAAMVSLVEHATGGRTPAPTAWLLT
jgi:low temperature requirement protein LtrA